MSASPDRARTVISVAPSPASKRGVFFLGEEGDATINESIVVNADDDETYLDANDDAGDDDDEDTSECTSSRKSSGLSLSGGAAVAVGPRVPFPPEAKMPLDGLSFHDTTDVSRIAFSPLAIGLVLLCLAGAATFIILTFAGVYFDSIAIGFQIGLPVASALAAVVIGFVVQRTIVTFDRRQRLVIISRQRMLSFCCCSSDEIIPFSALKTTKPKTTIGPTLRLQLIVDGKKLEAYRDNLNAEPSLEPEQHTAGKKAPKRSKKDKADNDDDDDIVIPIADVPNGTKLLRSWRAYVDWLRDDAF